MSIRAIEWAFTRTCPPTERFVLVAIADHVGKEGDGWPSIARIALRTGLSERAVRNAVRALEKAGLVITHKRSGGSSRYVLPLRATQGEGGNDAGTPAPDAAPPRHDVPPSPVALSTGTPAPDAGEGGTWCPSPRHDVPPTPARGAPEPSRTVNEPSLNLSPSNWLGAKAMTKDEIDAAFERWWTAYPKKVAKAAARKAFEAALRRTDFDVIAILQGVGRQLRAFDQREGGKFIPHPTTWLNGDRWLDGLEVEPDDTTAEGFDEFRRLYPRRFGMKRAAAYWVDMVRFQFEGDYRPLIAALSAQLLVLATDPDKHLLPTPVDYLTMNGWEVQDPRDLPALAAAA